MALKVDQMYAYVSVDDDGDEGICGIRTGMGWMPMVGADMARMLSLRNHAELVAQESGRTVRLVRFGVRELLDTITPRTRAERG